jgi:hypothetical protein
MANALTTTTSTTALPALASRPTLELVERLHHRLEPTGGKALSISSRYAPTTEQREALEARAIYLGGLDTPPNADKLSAAIGRLLQAMPTSRERSADAEATLRAYCAALSDMPLWATMEACMRFLKGQVEGQSPTFAPSPPELRREASSVAAPYRAEGWRIGRILSATVREEPDDAERARVLARWEEVRRSLAAEETAP